jgi:hypothetical protein
VGHQKDETQSRVNGVAIYSTFIMPSQKGLALALTGGQLYIYEVMRNGIRTIVANKPHIYPSIYGHGMPCGRAIVIYRIYEINPKAILPNSIYTRFHIHILFLSLEI